MTNKNILYKLFELKPNKYHLSNADMYEEFDILDIETNTNLDGLYWKFNNKLSKAGCAAGLLNTEIEKKAIYKFFIQNELLMIMEILLLLLCQHIQKRWK